MSEVIDDPDVMRSSGRKGETPRGRRSESPGSGLGDYTHVSDERTGETEGRGEGVEREVERRKELREREKKKRGRIRERWICIRRRERQGLRQDCQAVLESEKS